MKGIPDDSKPQKVEPTKVEITRATTPNATKILDNVLGSIGLNREEGGSA